MKKNLPELVASALCRVRNLGLGAVAALGCVWSASAQEVTPDPQPEPAKKGWEQILKLPNTYRHFVTSKGVMMASTLDVTNSGNYGIFVSEDKGKTWVRADVKDYNYSKFAENEEYVFATGSKCRVARSADQGKTWEVMNYQIFIEEVVPPRGLENNTSQGITIHNGKLYLSDMEGAGVIVSDDNGETWEIVDREGLFIDFQDGSAPVMDTLYNIFSFNGRLYAFGMYAVFRLNETTMKWEVLPINSNFMAIQAEHNGVMYCARGAMLQDPATPLLSSTTDGDHWQYLAAPSFVSDRYVRAMTINPEGKMFINLPVHYCIAYTPDFGGSWGVIEGLPAQFVMELTLDDEYLYASFYEGRPTNPNSGVWRYPLSEVTGLYSVKAKGEGWSLKGGVISFEDMTDGELSVSGVDGRTVAVPVADGKANVGHMGKGIYIFRAPNGTVGKFAL